MHNDGSSGKACRVADGSGGVEPVARVSPPRRKE